MRRSPIACILLVLFSIARAGGQSLPDSASRPLRWSTVALVGGVVAATAFLADGPAARSIHDHPSSTRHSTATQLERFGTTTVIGPTVGTLAVVGILTGRKKLTDLALNTTEAILVNAVVTEGIKVVAGRTRPRDDNDFGGDEFAPFSGNLSFPSGHTSAAFAFATSLGDAIDRPWPRAGLYALATGTAWARVALEAHWVSDVLAGAAVGIASAKFASGRRTIFGVRAPRLGVTTTGFEISWSTLPWRAAH